MIEIKNLTKRYGQIRAVDDISLTIKKGEILGFLGPNGAGKSTTMNILTGYISATSGSVSVGGYDIMDSPREAKRLIGYLPEQPPLYYDMTVNEYLRFICDLKSVPLKQRRRQLDEILYLVKIGDMRDRLIKNLSKGYKQRVGVAQALVGNPQVLVLDEPTVGLDPKQIIEIRKLIGALRHEHTIILSTHILQEVNAVCSTVAVINKGKLAASGSVSDFTAAEGTVSKFMISVVGGSGKSEIQKVLQNVDGVRRGEVNALAHSHMAEIELRPVGRTLEEIFIDIVSKEQVPAAE